MRGPGRITGRSVHNQRIEHFWRDLFTGVCLFYHLFYWLEDEGLFDPNNKYHLFALHYVFLLRRQLDLFQVAYSHHRIRGQSNRSPYQLWIQGMALLDTDEAAENGATYDSYGIEWDDLL